MKKLLAVMILLFGLFVNSFACINGDTKELKDGTIISIDKEGNLIPYGHEFLIVESDKKLKELDSLWKNTKDIDYLSDYGIVLIVQKKYTAARDIYLQIEKLQPNRYSTASNLGTVYELMGQNVDALQWINKAILIDPQSHKNSEWLHAKILEVKIKGDEYITSDRLINTDFGTEINPESSLSKKELVVLRDALYYQLNERISFIKPTDKIVAQLLFDLANVCLLTNEKNAALIIYEQAKAYGFTDPILQQRYKYAFSMEVNNKDVEIVAPTNYLFVIVLALVTMLSLVILGFLWRWAMSHK